MGNRFTATGWKLLRSALIAWLCLSVPSAALAGVLAGSLVVPAAQAAEAIAQDHQHNATAAPAHEHSSAESAASAQARDAAMAKASCHCVGHGCGVGGAGFAPSSVHTIPRVTTDPAPRPNSVAPTVARAHVSDLLRPPIFG